MNRTPGTCRYCHCSDAADHAVPPNNEPCAWADGSRTRCTAPDCIKAHQAAIAYAREYSLRHEEARRQQRAPRRRRKSPAGAGRRSSRKGGRA